MVINPQFRMVLICETEKGWCYFCLFQSHTQISELQLEGNRRDLVLQDTDC